MTDELVSRKAVEKAVETVISQVDGWNDECTKLTRAFLAAIRALPAQEGEVEGIDVDALASLLANIKQGESETPRCEPPGDYELEIAREWAVRALKANHAYHATRQRSQGGGE